MKRVFVIAMVLALSPAATAQTSYELLLKGGTVIDPRNGINAIRDVAISGEKIAAVAQNIPASQAKQTVDVTGFYVTPGLVEGRALVLRRGAAPVAAHLRGRVG